MFIDTNTQIASLPLVIRAYGKTEERLKGTCFRPTEKPLSGNFIRARNLYQLLALENHAVQERLVRDAAEAFEADGFGTYSVQIELAEDVGWASTAPLIGISEDELEDFRPNNHSSAKRVVARSKRRAPKTKLLTVVYEIREESRGRRQLAAVVHSAYPGPDVGELDGDVSAREGVAFFDWNHPGEK